MKKFCVNCNKKQGFLSVKYTLKDGVVCDDCLLPFGMGISQFKFGDSLNSQNAFEKRTSAEIMDAINGKNDVFAEIRNEMYSSVPAGVLFKF